MDGRKCASRCVSVSGLALVRINKIKFRPRLNGENNGAGQREGRERDKWNTLVCI